MHQPKILKFKLKKEKHHSRQIIYVCRLGGLNLQPLDKYLILLRYLQLNLQPPLTMEGTFHMKMCHNFVILQLL